MQPPTARSPLSPQLGPDQPDQSSQTPRRRPPRMCPTVRLDTALTVVGREATKTRIDDGLTLDQAAIFAEFALRPDAARPDRPR